MNEYYFDKRRVKATAKLYLIYGLIALPFMVLAAVLTRNMQQIYSILITVGSGLVVFLLCLIIHAGLSVKKAEDEASDHIHSSTTIKSDKKSNKKDK